MGVLRSTGMKFTFISAPKCSYCVEYTQNYTIIDRDIARSVDSIIRQAARRPSSAICSITASTNSSDTPLFLATSEAIGAAIRRNPSVVITATARRGVGLFLAPLFLAALSWERRFCASLADKPSPDDNTRSPQTHPPSSALQAAAMTASDR